MVKDPGTPPRAPAIDTVSDEMADLLAAYALDAVPAEQEPLVLAALAENPAARELLRQYRQVVQVIPYAVPQSTPSPLVRDAVLRAVHARRRRRSARLTNWQFSVAAVVLVGLLVWNIGLQMGVGRRSGGDTASQAVKLFGTPGLIAYDMVAEPAAPQATGRIYITPDEKQAAMVVNGLPALSSDHTYQLWFNLDASTPVSVATFTVDARGTAVVVSSIPSANRPYVSCWITEEPQSGSARPMGRGVLAAQWPTANNTYQP